MRQISLRIEEDFYEFIKQEADKNKISYNSMILKILNDNKNKVNNFSGETEESLRKIYNLVQDVQKISTAVQNISTASVLIARETLKETCKAGFFSQNYVTNDETGGEDSEKKMFNYINQNDKQTVHILKEAGVL